MIRRNIKFNDYKPLKNEERLSTRRINLRNISSSLRFNFDKLNEEDDTLLPEFERQEELSGLFGKFLTDDCYVVIDSDPNGDSLFLQIAFQKEEDYEPSDEEVENQYDLEIHITDVFDEDEIRDAIQILSFASKLIQKKWKDKGIF